MDLWNQKYIIFTGWFIHALLIISLQHIIRNNTPYKRFSVPMALLIADSGSTNATWHLTGAEIATGRCRTSGINPFYQNEAAIHRMLGEEFSLPVVQNLSVFFYGAGCGNTRSKSIVSVALRDFFHPASLAVESDLMAAARALCQHNKGMACILGTGSNACYYDGSQVSQYVPALGYILGDEGSGADIGRRLISDVFKKQLPEKILSLFQESHPYTADQIQENVYKHPFPNRFLAQFTHFVYRNIREECLHNMVKASFSKFFARNIRQYPMASEYELDFTGSIAYYFSDILKEAAADFGFQIGKIEKSPIEGLIRYHTA
jgi:hypothetical protein